MSEYIEYIVKCREFVGISGKVMKIPEYIDTSKEIVRCRDCEHFTYADAAHEDDDWCAKHEHIGWSVNGFCAWGEQRDA